MELRVLEFFTAFLLFLSIIRPLIRDLWKLDGLVICPLLSLGIMVGIFPAYGFRPECIPLLGFTVFMNIAHFPDLVSLFSGLHSDSYLDRGRILTFSTAVVFVFTLWIALYYAPPMNLDPETKGVEFLSLRDQKRKEDLYVRIYHPAEGEVSSPSAGSGSPGSGAPPLLILIPPVTGSLAVTGTVCGALRDRGFVVLTYSRPGFDSPAFDSKGMPVRLFFSGLYRLFTVHSRGLTSVKANAAGRALEEGRRQDTEFLLGELDSGLRSSLAGADTGTVFLAGYGAGGAALTVLAGTGTFTVRYKQVRGIVAVEAPILSSLEGDSPPSSPPPAGAFFRRLAFLAGGGFPKKITRLGHIPQPEVPVLFLLSDRVIQNRSGRYETVLRTLGASRNMALLAAVPGAGVFDYSGSSRYYPILNFLFRGASRLEEKTEAGPELTASLITNFAALALKNGSPGGAVPGGLKTTVLDSRIYLETGGVWQFPAGQTILQP
ncbi:MAG: hypothetical protein LBD31_01600 [Treponema sp.]|jgi:hypothetical protein|nr:hypothetical protein [Treponema sp.]